MGQWIAEADLAAALTDVTLNALYDDGTGTPNATWIAQDIDLAEAQVNGRLLLAYNRALPTGAPSLIKAAALQYAKSYAYDRRPEYAKGSASRLFDAAETLMESILEGSKLAEAAGPIQVAVSEPASLVGSMTSLVQPDDDGD